MAITMTITGETPLEIFATIKGCAAMLAAEVPEAKPGDKPGQAPSAPPAYIPVAKTAPSQQQAAAATPAPAAAFTNGTTGTPTPPPVPTAQTPGYTLEQIAKAGADLVATKPELMPTLMQLLQRYGAKMVTELKPEQLGSFATELRQMGAKI